mgnify:CR=1 FL=1
MIELIHTIFIESSIELRIMLGVLFIGFPLLCYFGIKGTDEAIDFQNKLYQDQKWRKEYERNRNDR